MGKLGDFLSPEAGQKRRQWLDETLGYYIPPELRGIVGLAAEVNPVTNMERASVSAKRVADPNVTGWDKVAAVGNTATNMAAVLAPVAGASKAGVPAANAIVEALTAASPMKGAVGDFAASEAGNLPIGRVAADPIATRGAEIMDMLKAGRGADVTDAMLDMGDPVQNARLNEWLFNNYDLPMDAASRAARAGDMGMDTAAYHATKADFQAFRPGWRGSNYFAQTAADATRGATFGALDNASPTSGTGGAVTDRVMSVMMPGDEVARLRPSRSAWDALPAEITPAQAKSMAEDAKRTTGASYLSDIYEEVEVRPPQWDARDNLIDPGEYRLVKKPFPAAQYGDLNGRDGMGYMLPGFNSGTDVSALEALSRNTGQKGFLVNDEAGTTIVAGPDMPIRSRFARFDPRLAHLRNLSAGLGLPLAAYLGQSQDQMGSYLEAQ